MHRRVWSKITRSSHHGDVAADGSHTSSSSQRPTPRPALEVLYPSPSHGSSNVTEVDIVAVHGLGSKVDWAWAWQDKTSTQPPVHWLKDAHMLPDKVPNARIIAYNYESRWHVDAPKIRLQLCGEELADSLDRFRADVPDRPIIFIAHSLGGLVVLHALLHADRNENLKHLPASTVRFAPLGTPFRGTKMQSLAKKVAWILGPLGSHDGIITELEQDDKHLGDMVHAFAELRERLVIPTTCFIELYDSDYGNKIHLPNGLIRGKVVEEESAHVPGWGRVSLYADHFKLNKFEGPADRSFQAVSGELRTMCINRNMVIGRRKQSKSVVHSSHFMIPFGRNKNFVGRDAILEQLLEGLPPSADRDDCQRTVIGGLGGIGKTQIALEAAYRVRDSYPGCSVFWVPAIDLASFENAYREIGQLLRLPNIDDAKADVKNLVKIGMSQTNAGSWLLIIDNADDTDLLFASANLAGYLPFSREGSILFTTRNQQIAAKLDIPQKNTIDVPNMDDIEATKLLGTGLRESQLGDVEISKPLLNFLANLPLAIKQASAYMALNSSVTVSQYLEFCQASNADLVNILSQQFEDRYRYKIDAKNQNPVATTWLISFQHISQQNPLAADYLKFMCFLAEKDIPLSLLPVTSEREKVEAIGVLHAYAFTLKRETPDSVDMHRLVRLVMRNWLQEKGEWEDWRSRVTRRLDENFPPPTQENKRIWTKYLPSGEAVLDANDSLGLVDYNLWFNMAASYVVLGKYSKAEHLCLRLVELCTKTLGNGHPRTLRMMGNLGGALLELGKYKKAEDIYRQTLELRERMLGSEHLDTLASKYCLAITYFTQNKYEEAEAMHKQVLELRKKVIGEKHADTISSMSNLAVIRDKLGRYQEAEGMHRQILGLREKVLGKEHPDTLQSMSNLATARYNQKNYKEAEEMQIQILALYKKVVGEAHPHTLKSMHNLTITRYRLGKHQEAKEIFRQTLELGKKVLGKEYFFRFEGKSHLFYAFNKQQKYKKAEKIDRQTLKLKKKVLSKKHPSTFLSMDDLAYTLSVQQKYKEAEEVVRQTLELRREVLGETHADTLASRERLAKVLRKQGKFKRLLVWMGRT
ncbi:hypothetical protein F4777DRAFT_567947 [Nemania sp. FL0916]|nr:hypothetical protein F4777DRAFT_567947 [Nemania sp. FL0916]